MAELAPSNKLGLQGQPTTHELTRSCLLEHTAAKIDDAEQRKSEGRTYRKSSARTKGTQTVPKHSGTNDLPVVLEVVDDVADGRVGAILKQPHFRALARTGEVALQSRSARVEHAVIAASARHHGLGGQGRGNSQAACLFTQIRTLPRILRHPPFEEDDRCPVPLMSLRGALGVVRGGSCRKLRPAVHQPRNRQRQQGACYSRAAEVTFCHEDIYSILRARNAQARCSM